MRLGILEAGRPPKPLDETFPRYPVMFADLLRDQLPTGWEIDGFAVIDGEFPESVTDRDAWLITGSAFGVYDPEPFIPTLFEFIRAAAEAQVPMVGICFGHQAIAEALGGHAAKSDKGWGVGAHTYGFTERPDWLNDDTESFSTYVSHQDQVESLPPGATVLASSEFCPNAMIAVGDKILTLQSHPEMPSAYVRQLYDVRRPRVGEERVDEALTTITETSHATDAHRVAGWIGQFLTQAVES